VLCDVVEEQAFSAARLFSDHLPHGFFSIDLSFLKYRFIIFYHRPAWPWLPAGGQLLACSSGAHGLNSAPNHPKLEHGVQSKHFYTFTYCRQKKFNDDRT
jgi:hypothetical protein